MAITDDQYYNDFWKLDERIHKMEEWFRCNEWKVEQCYYSCQDYEAHKDDSRFAFVDVKKS